MRRFLLVFLIFLTVSSAMPSSSNNADFVEEKVFYIETIDSFTRYEDQSYRSSSEREVIFLGYKFVNITNQDTDKGVLIKLQDDTTRGQPLIVEQPLFGLNFIMNATFNSDDTLEEITWEVLFFRDLNHSSIPKRDPFLRKDYNVLAGGDNRRFDLRNFEDFFKINLEYYEYINDTDGNTHKYKVNTELSTINNNQGRATNTAIHIIKRDQNQDIVYDYNYRIKEATAIQQFINFLDQPYLIVPVQLFLIFFAYYAYSKIRSYVNRNGIKIIREKQKLE